jgi:hypothetical protein
MVNFGYFALIFRKSARISGNYALRMAAKRCRQQPAAFNLAAARNHSWRLSVDLAELESQRRTQRAKEMKAVEVREPKGPLELVEREVSSSGTGQVLIKVGACGICHSDVFTQGRPMARAPVPPCSRA